MGGRRFAAPPRCMAVAGFPIIVYCYGLAPPTLVFRGPIPNRFCMIRHSVLSMRKRLEGHLWLSDSPAMLCWAALVGVLGAFSTMAFHDGIHLLQRLFTQHPGSIVDVTRAIPWYGQLLVPMCGGVAAGALLWAAARFPAGEIGRASGRERGGE